LPVALAFLFALVSVDAQTTDFFDLVKTATPQSVQVAIKSFTDLDSRDKNGSTPLIVAAAYNLNAEVITVLLKAGANVNAGDMSGYTPLIWAAARNQNHEVIMTLLNAGANPKLKYVEGRTAIFYAQVNESLKGTDALKQLEEASR
jgi:ankyrin repeat protein